MKAVKEIVRKYYKYGNTPNVTKVGNPTISNGVASGFSTSNYLTLPEKYDLLIGNKTWEFYGKFTTSNNVTTAQRFFCLGSMGGVYQHGILFGIYNGYANLSIGQGSNQSLSLNTQSGTILSNSTYTFKCNFTGTSYNIYLSNGDILPETPAATLESNKSLVASSTYSVSSKLGVREVYNDGRVRDPWLGSIDLKKFYIKINNEDVWHGTFVEESTESDYDFYKDVLVYKIVKENVRKYYKYDWETAFSPIFYSQTEATEGINGVKIINNAGYYYLTQRTTHTISRGNTVTFDMGETSKGITSIGFTGIVSGGNYPSLVMSNVQCSEDNSTWITIASSYGGRGTVYTNPLTITTPNNYRYIRFTASNDDGGFSQGGCQSLTVGYNKRIVINGTPDDYDFYEDVDVYKAIKSYTKGQYYGN